MIKKILIMVEEAVNFSFTKICQEFNFRQKELLCLEAKNQEEMYSILKTTPIDIFIGNAYFNGVDVVDAFMYLKANRDCYYYPKEIILLVDYLNEILAKRFTRIDVDNVFVKPVNVKNIVTYCINEEIERKEGENDIDNMIIHYLHKLGIPSHVSGYFYLKEALNICYNEPFLINKMTKELYPKIAATYQSTPSRVERSIRHAIIIGLSQGEVEVINEVFPKYLWYNKEKPTNSQFISLLVEYLRIVIKKESGIKIH